VVSHAAVVASHTTRQEPIIFLSSDHYIAPQESIDMHNQALRLIEDTLRQNMYDILVAGVHPNYPSSRFGYIQIDKQDQDKLAYQAVDVQSFREKPSMEVAEKYLEAGNYLWNFGAFAFDFNSLLKNVQPILPQAVEPLEKIYKEGEIKLENFRQLPKTSFDYAVLEHTQKLGVVGMNVQTWDDIGGVDSLYQYLSEAAKHEEQPQKSNVIQIDAKGNRVQTHDPRKKYALVGVSDLVVVETPEGLLIADPKKAGEVKKASQYFEEE
jgi:mannose-1-phosphate guanylyltransferase